MSNLWPHVSLAKRCATVVMLMAAVEVAGVMAAKKPVRESDALVRRK